ncbi:hypothetical protein R8Z50_02525 [Longispora sp. K20-0274]|uniref:hypothetical protein n=1 Tax=Longispora sp. K20-0274 TaxID=3088255 RepID=UPI00399B6B02
MTDARFAALDALTTEELRHRAFDLARDRRDLAFLVDVLQHSPDAYAYEQVDGSLGSVVTSVDEAIGMWSEFSGEGRGYGEAEPLLRAAFIDYLLRHGAA